MTTQNSLQLNINSAQPVPANHFQPAQQVSTPVGQNTDPYRELDRDLKNIKQNNNNEDPNDENSNRDTTLARRLQF